MSNEIYYRAVGKSGHVLAAVAARNLREADKRLAHYVAMHNNTADWREGGYTVYERQEREDGTIEWVRIAGNAEMKRR